MRTFPRQALPQITALHERPRGRLLLLTGARQVGKSTLAKAAFPEHHYIDLDSPLDRDAWAKLRPADWLLRHPRAVLDEVQKLPALFETVKACFDRSPSARYVLLGSSQVLLLERVRESLAGRVALRELFPLTVAELQAGLGARRAAPSLLSTLLRAQDPVRCLATAAVPEAALSSEAAAARVAWLDFRCWGGMPAIHGEGWTDEDRREWLQDYGRTYLERDLRDVARIDRLEPFTRALRAAAERSAQPINVSELARLAGVSPPTARQFLHYLEISYQVVLVPAWFRNREKRLTKRARLHFLDPGVRRSILRRTGPLDGHEYESAFAAELIKIVRGERIPVTVHHLRTADGREVDLLIEREDGFIAFELKSADVIRRTDARHLRGLQELIDKPLLLGLVVSEDPSCERLDAEDPLWKVPAARLLGADQGGSEAS